MTFTLAGFSTFKREGIELSAGFTATINARSQGRVARGDDHRLRTVADRRHAERDAAESDHHGSDPVAAEHRDELRGADAGAVRNTDVGGSSGADTGATFSIHGGRGQDTRRLIDGMRWNSMEVGNSGTGFYFDPTGAEEVSIQLGGNSSEYELGGVQVNLMPKAGGTRYRATCSAPSPTKLQLDGGARRPAGARSADHRCRRSRLRRERLARRSDAPGQAVVLHGEPLVGQLAVRARASTTTRTPSAWTYEPDLSRPAVNDNTTTATTTPGSRGRRPRSTA